MNWDCSGSVFRRLVTRIITKLSIKAVGIGVSKIFSPYFSVEFGPYVNLIIIKI